MPGGAGREQVAPGAACRQATRGAAGEAGGGQNRRRPPTFPRSSRAERATNSTVTSWSPARRRISSTRSTLGWTVAVAVGAGFGGLAKRKPHCSQRAPAGGGRGRRRGSGSSRPGAARGSSRTRRRRGGTGGRGRAGGPRTGPPPPRGAARRPGELAADLVHGGVDLHAVGVDDHVLEDWGRYSMNRFTFSWVPRMLRSSGRWRRRSPRPRRRTP
jgi:hypothetical protein